MYEQFDRDIHCHDDNIHLQQLQHHTTQKFMNDLNLSPSHPRCYDEETYAKEEFLIPTLPHGNHVKYEDQMSLGSKLYTIWCQVSPPLLAMSELWLRLFAFVLAPLIILYLISSELLLMSSFSTSSSSSISSSSISSSSISSSKGNDKIWTLKEERTQGLIIVIGLASSLVLLTDTMYVFCNNGRHYGASCFLFMITLTLKRRYKFQLHYRRMIVRIMIAIIGLSLYLIANSEKKGHGTYDHPGLDIPTIQPGFYYSRNNALMKDIADIWPEHTRTYEKQSTYGSGGIGATPYLPTGDSLTGIPFLVNKSKKLSYHRVWVQNEVDKEAVALDIKFPDDGIHSFDKPVFLILHGLNGELHLFFMICV